MTEWTVQGFIKELLSHRPGGAMTHLEWLRRPPRRRSMKTLLELFEKYQWLEERIGRGLPIPISKERQQVYARRVRRRRSAHIAELPAYRQELETMCFAAVCLGTLIDDMLRLLEIRITVIWSWGHKVVADRVMPARVRKNSEILAELRRLVADKTLTDEAFRARANILLLATPPSPLRSRAARAIDLLRSMNRTGARKVPADAPLGFVPPRWARSVGAGSDIDRRFYELCALSELKNRLRAGDLYVVGSRQFQDFEDYLLPTTVFRSMRSADRLGVDVPTTADEYLSDRIKLLREALEDTNRLAGADELRDARINDKGLKISPLEDDTPPEAKLLKSQTYGLLPHVKITDLLLEVDRWTNFTRHFTHLKSAETAADRSLLLTAILADAFNLGLEKMAEACPGTSLGKLAWLVAWHIRDDSYSKGLAELVNAQHKLPFAAHWGEGTTSSSDGQRFRAGGHGESAGNRNAKYGSEPGVLFYTHLSDQYAPFYTKVINANVRDATHVLDGLLYHESQLRIEEHYTDTAGFTDQVFALCHMLGFEFAPRIADLADKRIYVPGKPGDWPSLVPLIGAPLSVKLMEQQFDEVMRLTASIKQGTVTTSLILRKLAAYPRQNSLAMGLREYGRLERTLFTLKWLRDPALRRRVTGGLNKGEARNALARTVFFHRLGEIRDRSYENQRYRASGLNLVIAAITLWNTMYLERAVNALRERGAVNDALLGHIAPLGWNHIGLTGDYNWHANKRVAKGGFRPLRRVRSMESTVAAP